MKHNIQMNVKSNITRFNKGIAFLLLISQLLTSCGGFKEALSPSPQPQASSPSTLDFSIQDQSPLAASSRMTEGAASPYTAATEDVATDLFALEPIDPSKLSPCTLQQSKGTKKSCRHY